MSEGCNISTQVLRDV